MGMIMTTGTADHTPCVVYIFGAGNSGSTLLSMALGAHSQAVGVGELSRIDQFRAYDMDCSCGEPLSKCDLWGQVSTDTTIAPLTSTSSMYKLLRGKNWSPLLAADPHALSIMQRNLDEYREIASASKKPVIVDSSKDLFRLAYLYRSGKIRLVPVYLVRDGRAYIDSMKRRGFGAIWSLPRWIRKNLAAARVYKLLRPKDRGIRLDYHEFTQNPEGVLRHICDLAGMEYESGMLDYHAHTAHNIAGTRTRTSPKPIEPRTEWKKRLSIFDKLVFTLAGGHYFNRCFGVGKRLLKR